MIIDFVIICLKFIGFLFLINSGIALLFTLIEIRLTLKQIQLHKSSFYSSMLLVLFILTLFSNVLIYTYLIKMFTFFYHVEILSRVQLLFVLIPISIGISLMKSIANNSDRNFKQDYSKGIVTNFISGYINFGIMILIILELILLISPSIMKYLILFYNYILG